MKTTLCCLASASLAAGATLALPTESEPAARRSPEAILRSYVEDFRADPAAAEARTFGVHVTGDGGGEWTVVVRGEHAGDGAWGVDLVVGAPQVATFRYTVDAATLEAIDAGRMNALTASGKAYPDDEAPMDMEWMPGAETFDVNPFSFHFWTRGIPEKVPFRRNLSRVVHGANNVVFYYQEGFRSVWSSLAKGQGANNGPGQPIVAPFPSMIVVIAGRALGTMDGEPVEVEAGEMVFIPALTPHEWWNEEEQPAEVVLLMFGEGA